MNKYIFIGGTGRSGSNILKAILSQQSFAASLPFEPRYILDPDGIIDFYYSLDAWSPYIIDFRLRRLFDLLKSIGHRDADDLISMNQYATKEKNPLSITPPRYYQWELDKYVPGYLKRVEALKSELVDFEYPNYWIGSESNRKNNTALFSKEFDKEKIGRILSQFVLDNYDAFLNAQGKSMLIDDSTFSPLHIVDLQRLIPTMKLIHIYRDPRDVIASLLGQRWAPSDLDQVILWYRAVMDRWVVVKKEVAHDCYVEIAFEDLVHNYEDTLLKLSKLTDVDFGNLPSKIDPEKANIGRWEVEFSKSEKDKINTALAEYIERLGYL